MKKRASLILIACLACAPAWAEDTPDAELGEGFSLMEEGARLVMRGLLAEMEPALDELRDSAAEMGPALGAFMQSVGPAFGELLGQIDDLGNYDAPEILPNGDIIMRRSPDAPAWEPDKDPGDIAL